MPSDTLTLRRYTIVLAATWHRIRHPRGACMLTMLQLVPVGTAETILSLNAKDRVSQLGGTQAAGSHSMLQLVHESFLRAVQPSPTSMGL